MKRRTALRSVAMAMGGLMNLPAWAHNWNAASVQSAVSVFSASESSLLTEISETIIPATDTPGAKELGVSKLIEKIVADCLDKKAQETFSKGLAATNALSQQKFGKSFAACDASQRVAVVKDLEASTDEATKGFFSMVKGLTIRGYLTSEYVMTNLTGYQMAPGFYHGCVPATGKSK